MMGLLLVLILCYPMSTGTRFTYKHCKTLKTSCTARDSRRHPSV